MIYLGEKKETSAWQISFEPQIIQLYSINYNPQS